MDNHPAINTPRMAQKHGAEPNHASRIGTAHRLATLNFTGILNKRYGTVVDIGGYDGAICSRLQADTRIVAEPFPPEMPQRAAGVEFMQVDGSRTGIEAGTADLVLLLDVLEHVPEPGELIREALRLAKPTGTVIVTVPSRGIRIFPWFLQGWVDKRWDHTLRRGFAEGELRALIKDQAGVPIRLMDMGCPIFRLTYLPMSILWRVHRTTANWMLNAVARLDYRMKSVGRGHGYLFAELRRVT